MEVLILKSDIIDKIKADPQLFGAVAKSLNLSPYTLPKLLNDNSPKLTQASVIRILKQSLNIKKESDLLIEREPVSA